MLQRNQSGRITNCIFCQASDFEIERMPSYDKWRCGCPSCGEYELPGTVTAGIDYLEKDNPETLKRIARFLYETRDRGLRWISHDPTPPNAEHPVTMSLEEAENLYAVDFTPLQRYDEAVRRIAERTTRFGEHLSLKEHKYVFPTLDDGERNELIDALYRDGLIERTAENVRLTQKGLARAAELGRRDPEGSTVFIAACFSDELRPARLALHDTVKELGYEPYIVDLDPHNELIDLQIYGHIRQSRFVVADLTCNRQSVYYEVGFAHGLGVDAVLTCRADHFDTQGDDWKRVHFDLNHRNVLVWSTEEELKKKVRGHILQSFGRHGGG